MTRWIAVVVFGLASAAHSAPSGPKAPPAGTPVTVSLPGPAPEIAIGTKLDAAQFPAVPSFELPPEEPGFVDPRVLRVKGKKLLATKVAVKGYIIWIYNCVDAVRLPKEAKAKTQKRIDEDPTLCERPKFYLGSTKTTPPEKALWVVDVPRPPNKLEKQRLPKEEIKNWPKVPKYKLGDYVVVSGQFNTSSPHSERNSDGLLVFESITPAKVSKTKPAPVAATTPAARPAPAKPKAVTLAPVDPAKADASKAALARGNRAHGTRQYAEAVKAYREAIASWPQNHLAYYGMGGALAVQGDWAAAYDAFSKALALQPDQPMYQQWSGVAAYEKAVATARADEARKQNRQPNEVQVDLSTISFVAAKQHLELAVLLEPDLWRSHYYLGRIYRNGDEPRIAAEEFTFAARAKPGEQGPWVALAELYRRWDYSKEALQVATLGTTQANDSDLWFVLGMVHDDSLDFAAAVDAFSKALDVKADNHKARFQRGQAYFKLGKWAEAKADLEAFVKSGAGNPTLEFAMQQASKMIWDIDAKKK